MARALRSTNVTAGMLRVERITLAAVLTLALLSIALGWNHLSAPSVPRGHAICAVSATC